ncbi:N-acetyltransferase [Pseudovibrio sp. Tun.PSC04-5.I4]|uniref:GNAT family N-acetyltransferase n=1 Tax=Pseudovibrio sp. Tun.PSC04-5.I4 TaxID=1798213 RepID=UPI000887A817|nr:N-acetyltransferase [Pseudovibrio sp. Tun.PSC04-5.I4]SDR30956.1 putative acetyltransferase [Pseudovibrio sp. Tun.PSC04-5.I4]
MIIRAEQTQDEAFIRALIYAAFENHPHHESGAKPTEHLIVDLLRANGELTLSLVAEEAEMLLGHIAFSPVTNDGNSLGWFGLGPVAVSPDHQSKGIGKQLITEGMAQLQRLGAKGIVLLGEPGYYGQFGFQPVDRLILPGVPAQYFMAKPIDGATPSGTVAYSEAFSAI